MSVIKCSDCLCYLKSTAIYMIVVTNVFVCLNLECPQGRMKTNLKENGRSSMELDLCLKHVLVHISISQLKW